MYYLKTRILRIPAWAGRTSLDSEDSEPTSTFPFSSRMAPLLLVLFLPSCSLGFRFSVSRVSSGEEGEVQERIWEGGSHPGVSDLIVGLFDRVQGLTRGVAGLVRYFCSCSCYCCCYWSSLYASFRQRRWKGGSRRSGDRSKMWSRKMKVSTQIPQQLPK